MMPCGCVELVGGFVRSTKCDGIAHFAPSVLRAESTQGASGSPREKSLIFRVGLKIASAKGENPVRATTQNPLIFVEKGGVSRPPRKREMSERRIVFEQSEKTRSK